MREGTYRVGNEWGGFPKHSSVSPTHSSDSGFPLPVPLSLEDQRGSACRQLWFLGSSSLPGPTGNMDCNRIVVETFSRPLRIAQSLTVLTIIKSILSPYKLLPITYPTPTMVRVG